MHLLHFTKQSMASARLFHLAGTLTEQDAAKMVAYHDAAYPPFLEAGAEHTPRLSPFDKLKKGMAEKERLNFFFFFLLFFYS